jgi:hypothetical protein
MTIRRAIAIFVAIACLVCLAALPAAASAAPQQWIDRGYQKVESETKTYRTSCDMGNTPTGAFGPYYICVQRTQYQRMCPHSLRRVAFFQARFVYFMRSTKVYAGPTAWKITGNSGCQR